MNNELTDIRERMIELGIGIVLEHHLTEFANGMAQLSSIYRDGEVTQIDCGALIVVGARTGKDGLFNDLNADADPALQWERPQLYPQAL